ncbi:F-box/LRR-repeat protein, partial [Trifolium medium]|nr:F-box/LRR-repeat protein [Trifolium medium]
MGNIPNLLPSLQSEVARVDTLSDLPDDILTHILSFLPYKDAFRTTILSKRWLPLFHSLSDLNINDEGVNSRKNWTSFRQFMDAIMFSPRSQHVPLKSFHLKFRYNFWDANADRSTIDKWIEVAKQRHVEYLNLLQIPLAPTTVFCCKTLVVLILMNIRVANMFRCSVDLPLLKALDMYNVGFDDMENVIRLISG